MFSLVHGADAENRVENVRSVEGLGNHLRERNVQLLLHVLHDVLDERERKPSPSSPWQIAP